MTANSNTPSGNPSAPLKFEMITAERTGKLYGEALQSEMSTKTSLHLWGFTAPGQHNQVNRYLVKLMVRDRRPPSSKPAFHLFCTNSLQYSAHTSEWTQAITCLDSILQFYGHHCAWESCLIPSSWAPCPSSLCTHHEAVVSNHWKQPPAI